MCERIDPLTVTWYAVPNDLVGGWSIATVDRRVSELEAPHVAIGDYFAEQVARHVAILHNASLNH